MAMPYTTNSNVSHLRIEVVKLVINRGWSTRQVAHHYHYNRSTIVRWVQKARVQIDMIFQQRALGHTHVRIN